VEKDAYVAPVGAEKFKFEAEVSRMLDIVVNSLYQNKDVFLRELISNASDALDKIRFVSLTKPHYLKDEEKLQVQIEYDSEHNTLTIRDTGIGMTHDEMISNLGTVARSGTTKFMQALQAENRGGSDDTSTSSGDISQIGQFGVGFYSAFLVSDRVQVASKHPESDKQYVWTSANGASEFDIYVDPRGNTLTRGTEITLFLKEDCMDYANENKLSNLAKHYSEFVVHPIYLQTKSTMEVEVDDNDDDDVAAADEEEKKSEGDLDIKDDEEDVPKEEKPKKTKQVTTFDWEVLNGNPAIWTRSKEDISDEEYQKFYKVIAKDERIKAEIWTHFQAEGNINFKSILYVPTDVPQSWQSGITEQGTTGLSLYVRKVLISDEFDLLPRYLSFMKGVVDSDDLPLNVNRETLQESKIITVIKKKVVRKALEMLKNFQKEQDAAAAATDDDDDDDDHETTGDESEKSDKQKKPKVNKYNEWYKQFSPSLKMGAIDDEPNRSKIMKLLRFQSSTSKGSVTSLENYIENMKGWQNEIYYIAGDGVESVEKSPFMEPFVEKGVEVLYFVDPVDEYVASHIGSFEGKRMKNIAVDNVNLKDDDDDEDLNTRREKFYKEKFKPLTKWLKKLYGPAIMRVAISKRLVSAPAIVSSAEYGHTANMERIMRAQAYAHGQSDFAMRSLKTFEINPRHPMIVKLLELVPPDDGDAAADVSVPEEVTNAAWVLHEMALLNGGYPISDPEGHSARILKFLQSQFGVESLTLQPHPDLPVEEDVPPDLDDFDMDNMMDIDELIKNMGNLGGDDDGPPPTKKRGTSPEDAIPLTPDMDGTVHIEL
jgi:heat shock protein beta